MYKFRPLLLLLMATGLAVLISACGSTVSGYVYFEENGNQHKDEKEKGVVNATLLIRSDTESLGEVQTDKDGYYEFRPEKIAKKYCVSLLKSSIVTVPAPSPVPPRAPTVLQQNQAGLTTTVGSQDQAAPAAAQPAPAEEQPVPAAEQPAPATAQPTPALPVTQQATGSLEACRDHQTTATTTIDIAYALEYQKAMTVLPTVEKQVRSVGSEPFQTEIFYPVKCTLQPIVLPPSLELIPAANQSFNKSIGLFTKTNLEEEALVTAASPLPGVELTSETITLRIVKGAEGDISFTPAAVCPDNTTINLKVYTFQIAKAQAVQVSQTLSNSFRAALDTDASVAVNLLLPPDAGSNLSAGKLTMTFAGLNLEGADGCMTLENLGQKAQCGIDLQKGVPVTLLFHLRTPASIPQTTTYTVHTELTAPSLSAAISAEDITFSIPGPPPQQN